MVLHIRVYITLFRVYSLAGVISRNPLAPSPRTAILIIPRGLGSRVRRTSQNHRRMRKHVGQMNARTLVRTRDGWLEKKRQVGEERTRKSKEQGLDGEKIRRVVEREREREDKAAKRRTTPRGNLGATSMYHRSCRK